MPAERPNDAPKPDWRNSYQDQSRMHEDDLRDQRARGVSWFYSVPGYRQMVDVRYMTDDQIATLARREAERDVTRAIRQWNERYG